MKTTILLLLLILGNSINASAQNPHDTLFSPDITRLSNYGNNERRLELTDYSRQFIVDNYFMPNTMYKGKNAAIQVSVYDWNLVVPGDYQLDFDSISRTATWKLYKIGTTDTVYSSNDISILNHQYIPQWGLLVTVYEDTIDYSYTAGASIYQELDTSYFNYSGTNCEWVSGMEDIDNHPYQNWILEGMDSLDLFQFAFDTLETYEHVLNGRFSAGKFTSYQFLTSPWDSMYLNVHGFMNLNDLGSLDLVMTSDTSLWTRCPVVNMDQYGSLNTLEIMNWPSLNKLGLPDNSGTTGMSWFPGYAIDVEFGERLNIAFGENPSLINHNGNDGLFNPDSVRYDGGYPAFGGQHWVYIFQNQDRFYPGNSRMVGYDEGNYLNIMLHGTNSDKIKAWRSNTWVGTIQPATGYDFLDCDVTLKIRNKFSNIRHDSPFISFSDTARYQFTIPTSMPNSILEKDELIFSIYPNPSNTGIFTLENMEANGILQLEIFDIMGKILMTQELENKSSQINLSTFDNGIYFLRLTDKKGVSSTQKIILQQ